MSKLGVGQFDEDDLRLLEVLAGHASIALENARLYESLRREAENATVWLEFADAVSEARSVEEIGGETVRTVARVMDAEQCSLWIEDVHAANFRCVAASGYDDGPADTAVRELRVERAAAARLIDGGRRRSCSRPTTSAGSSRRRTRATGTSQPAADRAAARRLRRPRLDRRPGAGRRSRRISPRSACACSRASPTAPRSRSRSPCSSSPSRRAPRWRARCSSSPAGWRGAGARTSSGGGSSS